MTYKNSQDATTGTCPALWLSLPLWTAPSAPICPPSLFSVVSPAHILGPLLLAVLPTWDAVTPDIYMVHSLSHPSYYQKGVKIPAQVKPERGCTRALSDSGTT